MNCKNQDQMLFPMINDQWPSISSVKRKYIYSFSHHWNLFQLTDITFTPKPLNEAQVETVLPQTSPYTLLSLIFNHILQFTPQPATPHHFLHVTLIFIQIFLQNLSRNQSVNNLSCFMVGCFFFFFLFFLTIHKESELRIWNSRPAASRLPALQAWSIWISS